MRYAVGDEYARRLAVAFYRRLLADRESNAAGEALADGASTLWVPLGPLPMGEAALFIRSHSELRRLLFGKNEGDKKLIQRLLKVSRGHPLILDRLARLAGDPSALSAALDRVQADGWQQLPDLFDGGDMDDDLRERERQYLEDVAMGSVDLLIERISPDARRRLRIVTLANEPVSDGFIDGVWQGKTVEDEQLDKVANVVEALDLLPDDDPQKQKLAAKFTTDKGRQILEQLHNRRPRPEVPPIGPLLAELRGTGLLAKEASA